MLKACRQIVGRKDVPYICGGVCSKDAGGRTEYDEERHDCYEAKHFGQYEETGRVDSHNVKSVNLLGNAHGSDFRGNVRPYFSCKYEAHDGRRELEQHDFACGVARNPAWHPWALNVELHLYAYYSSDEKRDEQDDANGVDAKLRHLFDILLEEHSHALRALKGTTHEHQVSSQCIKPFYYKHNCKQKLEAKSVTRFCLTVLGAKLYKRSEKLAL